MSSVYFLNKEHEGNTCEGLKQGGWKMSTCSRLNMFGIKTCIATWSTGKPTALHALYRRHCMLLQQKRVLSCVSVPQLPMVSLETRESQDQRGTRDPKDGQGPVGTRGETVARVCDTCYYG